MLGICLWDYSLHSSWNTSRFVLLHKRDKMYLHVIYRLCKRLHPTSAFKWFLWAAVQKNNTPSLSLFLSSTPKGDKIYSSRENTCKYYSLSLLGNINIDGIISCVSWGVYWFLSNKSLCRMILTLHQSSSRSRSWVVLRYKCINYWTLHKYAQYAYYLTQIKYCNKTKLVLHSLENKKCS